MASYYWLKLWYEILDDSKMGMLSDRLYRRCIECFAMAGELRQNGQLPEVEQMAWRLRTSPEHLETELAALADVGILSQVDGQWLVTNFVKRQVKATGAERVARHREREKKREYYASETPVLRNGNDNVTIRYTDTDEDTDEDTDKDEEGAPPAPIAIYCDTVGQWPSPTNMEIIADRLGLTVDKAALEKAFNIWVVDRQYAATNYSGILDYYENIKANAKWHPDTKPSANGSQKETATERGARLMKEMANE